MSILVIGGDYIDSIKATLGELGASRIEHWDTRRQDICIRKSISSDINCVVFLTNYLHHNAMKYFKKEAKRKNIPQIYSKNSANSVHNEYCKVFGNPDRKS